MVGIGREIGRPSMIGLGTPPAAESKPLREKMTFMAKHSQVLSIFKSHPLESGK